MTVNDSTLVTSNSRGESDLSCWLQGRTWQRHALLVVSFALCHKKPSTKAANWKSRIDLILIPTHVKTVRVRSWRSALKGKCNFTSLFFLVLIIILVTHMAKMAISQGIYNSENSFLPLNLGNVSFLATSNLFPYT